LARVISRRCPRLSGLRTKRLRWFWSSGGGLKAHGSKSRGTFPSANTKALMYGRT
jgi:hypothetical protein